jgi:predicted Zn-dependent protease
MTAWLGWGNSLYAGGGKAGAATVFRELVARHPQAAVGYNNLAQTLADMGRWDEAEAMAQRAVALGGPWRAQYEQTLAEIRRQR